MPQLKVHPSELQIRDFQYLLPEDKIARFPLPERDLSKLLIYKQGDIKEDVYRNLSDNLPEKSLLLFNQAKVIHARLLFYKLTGGKIEVFCLEPDIRYADITTAMMQNGEVYWKCLLKGASKWKNNEALKLQINTINHAGKNIEIHALAHKIKKIKDHFIIRFNWSTNLNGLISFSEFLHYAGKIPIPPYLKRDSDSSDELRYQTIFAKKEGSVAAPTAALHFTPEILRQLQNKSIATARLTLHVGAGTFMPVKSEKMDGHDMHAEWIEITSDLVENLINYIDNNRKIVAVGTTSARTLESLYWIGVRILRGEWTEDISIAVPQWYPYERRDEFEALEALEALLNYLRISQGELLITKTQLIITPGYDFKVIDGLITNFHQPSSTLLLMIAAFVGNHWQGIYEYALKHDFRFLSYGDGSLLWRD